MSSDIDSNADDYLIAAAREGDDGAFDLLLERHRAWVCRLIYAIVQDAEQTEDLAQEAFYRVYQHLPRYTASGQFVPWLKRIAVNLARNFLRDRMQYQRRQEMMERQVKADPNPTDRFLDPAVILASRLLQEEVRAALGRLPAEQRDVLLFHYFGGLSVQEIAQQIGCPEGTVKSRLFHARRQLRQRLHPES